MKTDKFISELKRCVFLLLLQAKDFQGFSDSCPLWGIPAKKVSVWLQSADEWRKVKWNDREEGLPYSLRFLSFQPDLQVLRSLTECLQLLQKLAEEVDNISRVIAIIDIFFGRIIGILIN